MTSVNIKPLHPLVSSGLIPHLNLFIS